MNNIRKIRRMADVTLQTLADQTGTSKGYICDLERGNIPNPSIYRCYRIARALDVPLEKAFPEER